VEVVVADTVGEMRDIMIDWLSSMNSVGAGEDISGEGMPVILFVFIVLGGMLSSKS
jgi:hypothetical protein